MATSASTYGLSSIPALRVENKEDENDANRLTWGWELFDCQDAGYRLRDRTVEECIRYVCGQQWIQYDSLLGWKDITHWMTQEERRWRQRPVINRILPWYILTHARMTENPFIATFVPGPDRKDAELAELLDIIYKQKWRDTGMIDVWDRCAAWMIVAGQAFLQTRLDLNKGEWQKWQGKAQLPMETGDGTYMMDEATGQPRLFEVPDVPFDQEGKPLAVLRPEGLSPTGKPHMERKGDLVVDVLSPFEVRGQWGPIPWHMQRQHLTRVYLTPEEVFEAYGVECEPDIRGEAGTNAAFVERLLFGSGFFGAASALVGSEFATTGGCACEN